MIPAERFGPRVAKEFDKAEKAVQIRPDMNNPSANLTRPPGTSALLTDLYELTMACGYWKAGIADKEAAFHLSFRQAPFDSGFTIACGLAAAIEYLDGFHFEAADVAYLRTLLGRTRSRCSVRTFSVPGPVAPGVRRGCNAGRDGGFPAGTALACARADPASANPGDGVAELSEFSDNRSLPRRRRVSATPRRANRLSNSGCAAPREWMAV